MIRKIFKRIILISLVIAIVAILTLVFIIKYRIKSVIKEVVRRETNGVYDLDFSKISVNFTKGSVKLTAVDFKPVNTYPDKKDYRFTISDLYFSLGSWNQLFFHRKLFVDSLQINAPDITIFQLPAQKSDHALLHFQEIFKSLRNISELFKIRVLEITSGKIGVHTGDKKDAPVLISNINIRLENFGEKKSENSHLRYSDNLTLHIARQHWLLPSGQIIRFGNLFFSGKDQAFLVDSCSITMAPDNRGQRTSVYAEKLLFRTDNLASVFDKSELNIDTLYCKSPVLSFAMHENKKTGDTVDNLIESIHQLPGNINIKFINIENGQLHLTSSDGNRSYTSNKTNLKVYRLNINPGAFPNIRSGRIDLNLNEISFASRDSLYLLTVNEFSLDSNNLICRNAFLKPSAKAKGYLSGIRLPAFTLFDISLNDLLENRLKAEVAVIEKPHFFFVAGVAKKKTIEKGIPVNKFYGTLKELAQLIDVRWLKIEDGALDYHANSKTPELSLKDFDAEINLVDLLHSSSPRATKQAIHAMNIGTLKLDKDNTSIELKNFFINGNRQVGKLDLLQVQLSTGIRFNAANLYWERFSWEDFVRNKSIHIDTLNIPACGFFAPAQHDLSVEDKGALPQLNIRKLQIGESMIDIWTGNGGQIKSKVNSIALENLTTTDRIFYWQNGNAQLGDIIFKDNSKQIAVQRLNISANGESNAQNIEFNDSASRVKIPEIKFQLHVNNSGFENLEFPYLSVNGGYFNYQRTRDSMRVSARFGVQLLAAGIKKNNKDKIVFGKVFLHVDSLALVKTVKNGFVKITNLWGRVEDYPLFVRSGGDNAFVKSIINHVIFTDGGILYNDSTTIASVSKISGNGKEGTLALNNVEIKPRNTLESFLKTSVWQKDYLTFHCDSISLKHIDNQALLQDTALVIRYVYLQNPGISTFRDMNIAFQHGIEKLMPTKLIAGIKIPVQIDSVQLKGASVDVQEVSAITKREGVVPLRNLDALFKNVISRPKEKDSLVLEVSGKLLDYEIHPFRYAESYQDSLSGFTMNYGISPMQLSHLTEFTNPLSAIAITGGRTDTLYAKLSGNKYAASGEINFLYHNLKIRLLNKEDTLKKSLILTLESLLANEVIKSKNGKQARMFFIRDREKFVFNYWVKTLFSGLATSAGVKSNSKYSKMYKEVQKKYSLPAANVK